MLKAKYKMNQSFNYQQFQRLYKDIELGFNGISEAELRSELNLKSLEILNNKFEFDFFKNGNNIILKNSDISQKIILRKLNDNIKRIYKDEQANRRIIIAQIKTLLEENCPFWILKTDIKSFYESIDRNRILNRLKEDAMLSYHSLYLLKRIFENPLVRNNNGLPRGINISSTLSEYYMRKFDRWAKQYSGVYFYARFVDDIIIFTNSKKSAHNIECIINEKLSELAHGLKINLDKTKLFDGQKILKKEPLNYLGYKFYRDIQKSNHEKIIREEKIIRRLSYKIRDSGVLTTFDEEMSLICYTTEEVKIKNRQIQIGIARNKIDKIKTRIVKSFLDFLNNENLTLLEDRIRFLTGNYPIRKGLNKNELRAGIYYNYIEINNYEDLKELDVFYRKILFSKNNLIGSKIGLKLSVENKRVLKKYSFVSGFQNKIYHFFTSNNLGDIVKCW